MVCDEELRLSNGKENSTGRNSLRTSEILCPESTSTAVAIVEQPELRYICPSMSIADFYVGQDVLASQCLQDLQSMCTCLCLLKEIGSSLEELFKESLNSPRCQGVS